MEKIEHPLSITSNDLPVHHQYLYVLSICVMEFILFHLMLRNMAGLLFKRRLTFAEANHLSMSLVLSSFGKILLIVMVIWDYGKLNPSFFINLFVLVCNFVSLRVTLNGSFGKVTILLFYGMVLKMATRLLTGLYDPSMVIIL
jgi:hypothetical protein